MSGPRPIFATRSAIEDARRLGVERLENAVEEARASGRVRKRPPAGLALELGDGERFAIVSASVAAVLRSDVSPLGRPAWRVSRLVRLRPRRSRRPE